MSDFYQNSFGLAATAETITRYPYVVDTEGAGVPNYEFYHLKEITREQFDNLFLAFLGDERTGDVSEEDFYDNFDVAVGFVFGNESEQSFYVRDALTYDVFQQWQVYFSDPTLDCVSLALNLYPLPTLVHMGDERQEFEYNSGRGSRMLDATQWEIRFPHTVIALSQADDSYFISNRYWGYDVDRHDPAEIWYAMAGIDLGMLSLLDTIEMKPDVYRLDSVWEIAHMAAAPGGNSSDVQVFPLVGEKRMDDTHSALVHEIAHLWSIRKWGESMESPEWLEWNLAIRKDGVQTDYSPNLLEDLASSYELYEAAIKNPDKDKELREKMPHRFAILDKARQEIMTVGMEEPSLFAELDVLYSQIPEESTRSNADEGIKLCEQILALDPEQNLARETLADLIIVKTKPGYLNIDVQSEEYWQELGHALEVCPYSGALKLASYAHSAKQAKKEGDYVGYFTNARKEELEAGYSPFHYEWTYRHRASLDKGIEAFEGVIPQDADTAVLMASLYAGNRELQKASEILQNFLGLDELPKGPKGVERVGKMGRDSVEALMLLAKIKLDGVVYREALVLYQGVLLIDDENYEVKDFIKSQAEKKGFYLLITGNFDLAQGYLKLLLQVDPKNQKAHEYLGYIYMQREEVELALQHFEQIHYCYECSVYTCSVNTKLLNGMTLCYLNMNDFDKALEKAEQVLQVNPSDPTALLVQGVAWLKSGRTGDGRVALERLNKTVPGNPQVQTVLAFTKVFDEYDYWDGIGEMKGLAEEYKDDPVMGDALQKSLASALQIDHVLKDPEALNESQQILETLLEENPDDVEAKAELANAYLWMERYGEAIILAGEVLDETEVGTTAYYGALGVLGLSLAFGEADYEQAKYYLLELKEKEPNNFHARLGLTYLQLQVDQGLRRPSLERAYAGITELYQDYPANMKVLELAMSVCEEYGGFLNKVGEFEKAEEILEEAEYYKRQMG